MSQAQAKALRRTVRRSLGDHGAQAYQAMHTLASEVSTHTRQLDRAFERIERLEAESKAQRELTLAGRLAWLVRGV